MPKGKKGKRGKEPRIKGGKEPANRQVRTGGSASSETDRMAWGFGKLDMEGPWGPLKIDADTWWKNLFPKLQNFETMTWADVQAASGGRSHGSNSHFVPVENLSKNAKARLDELKQDDVDELFSLRLSGKERVYGIRDGRVLKVLWYDPDHEVYPVEVK